MAVGVETILNTQTMPALSKLKTINMKFLLMTIFFLVTTVTSKAQNSFATQIAEKIAQRMKDSLLLSDKQKDSIYSLNIRLNNEKAQLRSQYADMDSLQYHTQRVEASRDSLYRTVLDEEKYRLYKTKKRNLITNN